MSSTSAPTAEKILDAALALLEARPAGPVRMSDIAKAAGISRQAVYLHHPTRGQLLVAAARRLDVVKDVDARLRASRTAQTGRARLAAYIAAWAAYIPEIHGVARALMAMQDSDPDAAAAWADRMDAFHQGCAAAVDMLAAEGALAEGRTAAEAADLLFALLSVRNWEILTRDRGWPQARYAEEMARAAEAMLLRPGFAPEGG